MAVVELGVAEREVVFADDFAALKMIFDVLAGDLVGRARPDVVGTEQIEGFGVFRPVDPVQAGDDLLRCLLARVDDVLRLLETFVEGGIVQHAVELFEDGQHGLAGGGGPAAEDRGAMVDGEELFRFFGESRPIAGAVFLDKLDLAAEHAALLVYLVDGEFFGLDGAGFADCHCTGDGVKDADGDRVVGNREAGCVDG